MQVAGAVSIDPAATLTATAIGGFVPAAGDTFTLVENTSGSATTGTFAGKPQNFVVSLGGVGKVITYTGGLGANDVVLLPFTAGDGCFRHRRQPDRHRHQRGDGRHADFFARERHDGADHRSEQPDRRGVGRVAGDGEHG
jgi:hypothetical protein